MDEDMRLEPVVVCRSHPEWVELAKNGLWQRFWKVEEGLAHASGEFQVPGICAICERQVGFHVDFKYATTSEPNWRERMVCPSCNLNNRLRLSLHFLDQFGDISDNSQIYITEQTTELYSMMRKAYPTVIGSEYLRDGTKCGAVNKDGLRHEDVTALSFADGSFDLICTYDVLEHVPDYREGLKELIRCLKPKGRILITVPFDLNAPTTQIRARHLQDGSIEHLMPPIYHADPLSPTGVLCYQIFGWDILAMLSEFGVDGVLQFFWSEKFGYLGGLQFVIFGCKT
jgi:SAM-dependent methyltransferase